MGFDRSIRSSYIPAISPAELCQVSAPPESNPVSVVTSACATRLILRARFGLPLAEQAADGHRERQRIATCVGEMRHAAIHSPYDLHVDVDTGMSDHSDRMLRSDRAR